MSYAPLTEPDIPSGVARMNWSKSVAVVTLFLAAVTVLIVGAQPELEPPLIFSGSVPELVQVGENRPIEVDVATSPPADTIEIASVDGPATAVLSNTILRIEPEPEAEGTVTVGLNACIDGECVQEVITAEVFAENDPPLPGRDQITAGAAQQILQIPVLENDVDEEGHPLSIVSAEVVVGEGTVGIVENNTELLFTATPGSAGDWTLAYVVSDGQGGFAEGTVTVSDGDAPPEPRADQVTMSTGETIDIEVLENDLDDGGVDALIIADAWIEDVRDRSVLDVSVVGEQRIRLVAGAEDGVVEVAYAAQDERGRSTSGTLTVTIEPLPPQAIDDEIVVIAGQPTLIDVLANDTPADGIDPTTLAIVSSSSPAIGVDLSNGQILYSPALGESGNANLTYEICNASGQCDTANASIVVDSTVLGLGELQINSFAGPQFVPWAVLSSGQAPVPANAVVTTSTGGVELFNDDPVLTPEGALIISPIPDIRGRADITISVDGRTYEVTLIVS